MTPATERLAIFKGAKAKPIGGLVMAAFAEVRAPVIEAQYMAKQCGLDGLAEAYLRGPSLTDSLALMMQEVDRVFEQHIALDRKAHADAESLTWKAKKTGRSEYVIHRVTLVPAEQGRLEQPNVARVWIAMGKSEKDHRVLCHILDQKVMTQGELIDLIMARIETWRSTVNSARVRVAYLALLRELGAVPFMPEGTGSTNSDGKSRLSFVPRDGLERIAAFRRFMEAMARFKITPYNFGMRSVPVWDTEEVRRDLQADVAAEVNRRLDELAEKAARDILNANDAHRLEGILERRLHAQAKIMGMADTYDDLLRAKIALRDRMAEPKLLKAAQDKLEKGAMTPRARALFANILSRAPGKEPDSPRVQALNKHMAGRKGAGA